MNTDYIAYKELYLENSQPILQIYSNALSPLIMEIMETIFSGVLKIKDEPREDHLTPLYKDPKVNIFSFLDGKDLAMIECVNTQFKCLLSSQEAETQLWPKAAMREFPEQWQKIANLKGKEGYLAAKKLKLADSKKEFEVDKDLYAESTNFGVLDGMQMIFAILNSFK